ncbi:PTS glucose transporter subunit IIA [Catenovulum sp. 2E275]|uniref:PTS glucose transporter subunit IIA n=1 Tax=Catenovulum sp. 2E275 TaxID=2980497 RepID=UPI0021D2B16E|nr:PTS glucose transporter subunit IIA [Catenovulum sp. 2E275]MCU4674548.1 PTS glucose transporter subunit IIA [Catenovulum sp. 2E275]
MTSQNQHHKTVQFELNVYAPCNSKITGLDTHPTAIIKDGFLGLGVCFNPLSSQFFSPIDGEIVYFPKTCHQLRLKHSSGLLIHIEFGINTPILMAQSFVQFKNAGQKVTQGELLFEYNLPLLNNRLESLQSFIGVANLTQNFELIPYYHSVKATEDIVFTIKK